MTRDEKLAALEAAERAVLKAIELIDSTWGEPEERTPRATVSLSDACNLLERAGGKIAVGKRHLEEGK